MKFWPSGNPEKARADSPFEPLPPLPGFPTGTRSRPKRFPSNSGGLGPLLLKKLPSLADSSLRRKSEPDAGQRPHRGGVPFPAINVVRRGVSTRPVFVQGLRLKNAHLWTPTKFVLTDSGLEASRDPREVSAGSRLMTSILAGVYEAALRRHARGVLVDLGCARAPLYQVYRDQVSEVLCIDRPQGDPSNSLLDYEVDLEEGIPLPSERADTLLATDFLMYNAKPDRLWPEMARVLRPGGKLIIGSPFLYWLTGPDDRHRYSELQLRTLCSANRLSVLSIEAYGGAPEVLLDLTGKLLASRKLASKIHSGLARWLLSLRTVRRVSASTSAGIPLGYCLVAEKPKEASQRDERT